MVDEERKKSWRLKKAAKKILLHSCCSFSSSPQHHHQNHILDITNTTTPNVTSDTATNNNYMSPTIKSRKNSWSGKLRISSEDIQSVTQPDPNLISTSNKNLCAICLDPLNFRSGSSPGNAIFTAQCSHSFHFSCISSNVRHGSVTCPICRAHWTQLPRNLIARRAIRRVSNLADPVIQILDDSISTFRVHRRRFLRSARYNDDDPIEPTHTLDHPRLHLSLLPVPLTRLGLPQCSYATPPVSLESPLSSSSSLSVESPSQWPFGCASTSRAYLCLTLADQPATDLVLVASPNGPHLRLLKQSMAFVVSSLRPIDRLAIVTYSSAAARVFPLRCMTSYGKRTAMQVIDRLFYMGQADPIQGLKKGVKILSDRVHKNPLSCILHMSDNPTRSYHLYEMAIPVTIHHVNIGFGFGTSNGFLMHEIEEFLARILEGAINDVKLRVGEDTRIVNLGELRGGEDRRIPITLNEHGRVCVEYSYIDTGFDECTRGEIEVCLEDTRERDDVVKAGGSTERPSSVENWDYHDPFMARRWAKHLHGYRP